VIAMTSAIVPRRIFDEEDQPSSLDLRDQGLIRVHGTIPIALNERLKAMARSQGKHASQLIGELIQKSAAEVDKYEAKQAKLQLQQQFGPNWLQMLQEVD
jgi:predicted DNA-binding protein